MIEKGWSWFYDRYSISTQEISVEGDLWDMNFDILNKGDIVGSIQKKGFTLGDTYEIMIIDEDLEELIVSFVVAIDCVQSDRKSS